MIKERNDIYLGRDYSDAIKGILIVFIVIGHNHILCPNTETGGIMQYLYTFHVVGFFILPFFYDKKTDVTWRGVLQTIARCWIPYFWICLLCFVVMCITKHQFDFGWGQVSAFFNGTQSPIRKNFGFIFPWFLPTFCSFSIMLSFARRYRWLYILLLVLGLCTLFMTWEQFYSLKNTIPFGGGLAVSYFGIGVIAFELNRYSRWIKYMGAVAFALLSVSWWMNVSIGIFMKLIPSAFFLALLCVMPYFNYGWLRLLGRYSLGIYLFHVFLTNATYMIFPHKWVWGWIGFAASLVLSLLMTMGIYHTEHLRKLLFPRSWEEIIHIRNYK